MLCHVLSLAVYNKLMKIVCIHTCMNICVQIYQRELKVRMEQMHLQQAAQEAKYGAIGRELPQEISQQLQEVFALEKTVAHALHQKEEELVHIHQDREEYQASLTAVTAWLQQASQQLQERIINLPETRTRHQVSSKFYWVLQVCKSFMKITKNFNPNPMQLYN